MAKQSVQDIRKQWVQAKLGSDVSPERKAKLRAQFNNLLQTKEGRTKIAQAVLPSGDAQSRLKVKQIIKPKGGGGTGVSSGSGSSGSGSSGGVAVGGSPGGSGLPTGPASDIAGPKPEKIKPPKGPGHKGKGGWQSPTNLPPKAVRVHPIFGPYWD